MRHIHFIKFDSDWFWTYLQWIKAAPCISRSSFWSLLTHSLIFMTVFLVAWLEFNFRCKCVTDFWNQPQSKSLVHTESNSLFLLWPVTPGIFKNVRLCSIFVCNRWPCTAFMTSLPQAKSYTDVTCNLWPNMLSFLLHSHCKRSVLTRLEKAEYSSRLGVK